MDFGIDFGLVNASDGQLFVGLNGQLLDEVIYGPATSGTAKSLDPDHLDPTENDDTANWCPAVDSYGAGDLGTPAEENPSCSQSGQSTRGHGKLRRRNQ